ncbi:MAG TPA: hypothetical protein VN207_12855 [Ktedonobacteraceae bacterium]|nr:hypothetical protein [Ktedonobacteraceae bacterium]
MDVSAITQFVNHIITSLEAFAVATGTVAVSKVGEGAANKAGEDLLEQGKKMLPVIRRRCISEKDEHKDDTALLALNGFLRDPVTFRTALESKLRDILMHDSAFSVELRRLMQSGPMQHIDAEHSTVSGTRMVNRRKEGVQSIRACKSKVKNNIMEIN